MYSMKWIAGINFLVGIWMFISPWVLGFTGRQAAAWSAWISGAIVLILAGWRFFAPSTVRGERYATGEPAYRRQETVRP